MARTKIRPLQVSKLKSQTELIEHDLDLEGLALVHKGKKIFQFDEAVIHGEVERTIEGASTVTITVNDRSGAIRNSGRLGSEVDIRIDGLWFRLVKVEKTGNDLKLTFEDREVAILRTYNKKKLVAWGKTTREWFAWSLVNEVKEQKIKFICPNLKKTKPLKTEADIVDAHDRAENRQSGFGITPNDSLTVKGRKATIEQLRNAQAILDVGTGKIVRRKLLVCSIMTVIQEATLRNLKGGHLDSVGLFQQRRSQGWPASRDIVKDATAFFDRAIRADRDDPNLQYYQLCQEVQRSAYPEAYAQWRVEAERLVTAYGIAGYDSNSSSDTANANNMSDWAVQATEHQYSRGWPKKKGAKQTWEKEDSWSCLQRLADEIDIRCYAVSGVIYFISEPDLFKSAARARISEKSDGIDWIDFDYDVAKPGATVTITCRIARWDAPPGTIIEVFDSGPINGRWLVSSIRRPFFSDTATITAKKPRARLPEPKRDELTGLWDNPWTGDPDTGGAEPLGPFSRPLKTPMPTASQFNVRDPEGAPDSSGKRWHAAVDWFAKPFARVYAPQSGEVVEIGPNRGQFGQIFGASVKIQTARGYVWVFRHVDPIASLKEGQRVEAGENIARVTRWGTNPSSSHAHIELWETLSGGYHKENMIDPLKYIKDVEAGLPV